MNDRIKYLKDNKHRIADEKRASMKCADGVSFFRTSMPNKQSADKDDNYRGLADVMMLEAVINTTGLLDSHEDVHIPGLWDRSIADPRLVYLLQEHEREFDHVISDQARVSVQEKTWKELGAEYEGSTQALIFTADVHRDRNPYMFDQYLNGYVRNHSVGMRYVSLELCINSDEKYYIDEKEAWDKYIGYVANREDAETSGYFWAVTEAKLIEGSAVLFGSNWITPTISVEPKSDTGSKSLFSRIGKIF